MATKSPIATAYTSSKWILICSLKIALIAQRLATFTAKFTNLLESLESFTLKIKLHIFVIMVAYTLVNKMLLVAEITSILIFTLMSTFTTKATALLALSWSKWLFSSTLLTDKIIVLLYLLMTIEAVLILPLRIIMPT